MQVTEIGKRDMIKGDVWCGRRENTRTQQSNNPCGENTHRGKYFIQLTGFEFPEHDGEQELSLL